jgi:3-hydroxyisobutyrate dehydrogenase-like beta-hydroxyacid dehydrogenase
MGLPMAGHLAARGITLRAWNRTGARSDSLRSFPNVQVCASAAEAVRSVGAVIVMLSTGDVVDEILSSVSDTLEPSSLVIVMSSIPVATARSQAEGLRLRGVLYVDAPVSGGEKGAQAATLTIMAGGDAPDVLEAESLLQPLGKLTHVGPVGAGQLAKLANQLIVGVTIGAVAEALLLAGRGGADIGAVREALLGGFADSTILRQHGQRMVTGSFEPGAHVTTQLKDMATAQELARSQSQHLPFLELAAQLYRSACEHGLADRDHSALYLELERRSRDRG